MGDDDDEIDVEILAGYNYGSDYYLAAMIHDVPINFLIEMLYT